LYCVEALSELEFELELETEMEIETEIELEEQESQMIGRRFLSIVSEIHDL